MMIISNLFLANKIEGLSVLDSASILFLGMLGILLIALGIYAMIYLWERK